jgi:hypothetical protein
MSANNTPSTKNRILSRLLTDEQREQIFQKRVEIAATILLALATIATAWSGYQSARWGGEQTTHASAALKAIVRSAHFESLALQKMSVHVSLFGQFIEAELGNNQKFADFILSRFPEPLKAAAVAWEATEPFTNPSAPASPFEMPEYALPDAIEAARWDTVSEQELLAAEAADAVSDRYLLFTIVFASVLFFGGVSGKFGWQPADLTMLVIGIVGLLIGLVILLTLPIL